MKGTDGAVWDDVVNFCKKERVVGRELENTLENIQDMDIFFMFRLSSDPHPVLGSWKHSHALSSCSFPVGLGLSMSLPLLGMEYPLSAEGVGFFLFPFYQQFALNCPV